MAKLIAIFTDAIGLYRLIQGGQDAWHAMLKDYNLLVYLDGMYGVVYDEVEDDRLDMYNVISVVERCAFNEGLAVRARPRAINAPHAAL